jgi:enoyl-CoA hydratase/carnithine racemase
MPGELKQDRPAEGVLRLTISNPSKRGALDHPILDGIAEVLDALDPMIDRAVILRGEPGVFSSGYDIGDIPADVLAERAEKLVAHPFTSAIDALDRCAVPVVAQLTGHTIGGGLELALACDLRIASDEIKLGMPPAKLGLVYSHTGLRRFLDAIGEPRTRELFLLGRYIDAATAEAWSLVNLVAPADGLEDAALDWATELAGNAPLSLQGNKRVLRALLAHEGEVSPPVEQELIALRRACFLSDDFAEGVRAFGERRKAEWKGR